MHCLQNRDIFAAIVVLILKNTETEVQKNSFHVEHFRPQAQNQDLSLTYNNLHASCNGDNRRHCGHKKENNFDAKRMISPLEKL